MIFFKPTVDKDSCNTVYFQALENEKLLGECRLVIEGSKAFVSSIDCEDGSFFIVDGLIKSAFNYACAKNCYMGYITGGKYDDMLDRMSLNRDGELYFNDIPTILTGNCCKNKS